MLDLNCKPAPVREGWLNIYPGNVLGVRLFATREEALKASEIAKPVPVGYVVACIKVQYTEGEGL